MPRNERGGKGAKKKSNKKEQAKKDALGTVRALELPDDSLGQIICRVEKIYGGGRFEILDVSTMQIYTGRLRKNAHSCKPGTFVIAQFRACNTEQKEIDMLYIYNSSEVRELAYTHHLIGQGMIIDSVIIEDPDEASSSDEDDHVFKGVDDSEEVNIDDI